MSDALVIEGLSGFLRGKKQSFTGGEIVFGTNDTCQIRFDPTWDKTVSARHATLRKSGSQWELEDHSKAGTFISGRRIIKERLAGETTIELGKGGPKVKISPAAEPQPQATRAAAPVMAATTTVAPVYHSSSVEPPSPPPPVMTSSPKAGRSSRKPVLVTILMIVGGIVLLCGAAYASYYFLYLRFNVNPGGHGVVINSTPGDSTPAPVATGDWNIVVDMGEEIFPSFIVASATMKDSPFDTINDSPQRLGDKRSIIGVEIANPAPNTKVRIEIEDNEIMHSSVYEAVLPEAGVTYRVYPTVNYKYDTLPRIKQATPLAITLSVAVNGAQAVEKSKSVRVASINECPFAIPVPGKEDSDDAVNMSWMFSAYVNENHPISDELRKDALKSGVIHDFIGYQGGKDAVYQQVFAIWNVLQQRGVRYSNITTTPDTSKAVYSQYVRFIDQSINNSQANCVDGSVLFASVLRQIGIEPILVIVPGHMFVGFYLDPDGKDMDFLETTMIGQVATSGTAASGESGGSDVVSSQIRGVLNPVVPAGVANQDSLNSFLSAIKAARQEVTQNFGEGDNAGKVSAFKGSTVEKEKANCQLLPVIKAREMGVMPIGYQP